MELVEFLEARIAEDEAGAAQMFFTRLALPSGGIWMYDGARLRAECEAKRRIVGWFQTLSTMTDREALEIRHNELLHVLATLALPYADHPDYREAWQS